MAQTNTKSDFWCGYNQSASPLFWILEPYQYFNTFAYGEVGINATGGVAGSYVRPDVIDINSFLSGRDDILSKCQPPSPDLDELKKTPLIGQNKGEVLDLLPKYTKEKKSAVDLSTIDYNRWIPQHIDPQDLRFVLEDFSATRGGLNTQNYSRLVWNNVHSNTENGEGLCNTILDPSRACGPECETVSGYPGSDWITGKKKSARFRETSKPPNTPDYPFRGPYSQDVMRVGADQCGENVFYGPRYDRGKCPNDPVNVLTHKAKAHPHGFAGRVGNRQAVMNLS